MANIEKHPKPTMEQIDHADSSAVPTCARASHVIGRYIKDRHNDGRSRNGEGRAQGIILRLQDLPATPGNLERIRKRIRLLNRRLAASGTPFRVRVI